MDLIIKCMVVKVIAYDEPDTLLTIEQLDKLVSPS